jgi:hypothetical protein
MNCVLQAGLYYHEIGHTILNHRGATTEEVETVL